jgi:histidine kinase
MITINGYESCEVIADTPQFSLLRVEDILLHEKFIAKVYPNPSEQQVQSLKNIVQLVQEKNWKEALEPVCVLSEKDNATIIFKDVPGYTLQQYIRQQKKIKPSLFVPLAIHLCNMVSSFHANGWIIGNLRPEHIFIDNETSDCKIADFRKASKVFKREPESSTQLYTPEDFNYISPEQTGRINQVIDYRSDYYSLGIIFYEMLTGKLPFASNSPSEILHAHIARQPAALNTVDPYLPRVLNDIVLKLLSKNAENRYQSWRGLIHDLENSIQYFHDENYLQSFKLGGKDYVNRITIPGRLMGRDDELNIMNDAYTLAGIGKKQTLYISGYSGIGKTRLVQEFQHTHMDASSFITKAKFDALQRNSPYSALIAAIRELIRNLLREDEAKLAYWKMRLLEFLQGNGQIIINVVPELEIVIGKQPVPTELPPDESQNRFQQTFLNFISAFSSGEHTLVIFLDDLQWADLASIKLIELMILDNVIKNFFFIGAFRDHEVDPTHPFYISLKRQEKKADVKDIHLSPLTKETINHFILETLQHNVEKPAELLEKIFQRTQGNIFFTIQLITSLNDSGLLYKNQNGNWVWDENAFQQYNFAENVIELLVQKINNLDDLQKNILRTGACVGDSFDLFTITNILDERLYIVANKISEVINMGYLVTRDENLDYYIRSSQHISDADFSKIGNVRFQFSHDRIRQACLSLVDKDETASINLKAGQFKLKNYSAAEIDEEIFFIANHFNNGRQFITEKKDLEHLVEINLRAGKKAKEATAYDSALNYFRIGKEPLNFNDNYRQLYDFYLQGAECKYQTGQYTEAEEDLDTLYANSQTRPDKLEVLILKVFMYTSKDEKEKAVETGRAGFRLYGLLMPRSKPAIMMAVLKDILKARFALRGKKMDQLPERKIMQDAEQVRFLEFALAVSPTIYQYDQNLFAWDVMKMVHYSLKYGNNGVASFGYTGYGMILAQTFGDYQAGKKMADIAILINKQLGYTALTWRLRMTYHNFVQHWTMPVRPEFDTMQENINGCISNGDPVFAGYGIFHYHQKKFALGFPLAEVQQSIENYFRSVDQRGDKETRHFLEAYYYAVRVLRGEDETISLKGNNFNVADRLAQTIASSSFTVAADTYIAYINILYQFQLYEEAWQHYLEGTKYMEFIFHRFEHAEFCFYGGLICAIAYEKKLSPAKPYLKLLKSHLKKLKRWSENCPDNYQPQYLLLDAELARVTGKSGNAASLYEKAIQSADKYLFVNYKALAYELAGRYHFASGNAIIAKTYLENARKTYMDWGAILKVKYLEKEFSSLLGQSILVTEKAKTNFSPLQNADLSYILEASHSVNSIKDVDEVVEQLMRTVIQNSGADTGYILIRNRADLVMKASYTIKDGARSITEYPEPNNLPLSVIRYASRLKEPLIINSPAKQNEYSSLAYFASHKPLSVLIFPIMKQGELFGVLYLENYSNEGVFDSKRIGILNLISGQIAMMLDNAHLYKNMESLVKERTEVLETEKNQMLDLLKNIFPAEAIEELKATGKTTPQKLENITVMMADIKGFTKISEKLNPEELINLIDSYFRGFDEIIGKYGLEKIKTIGDAYMAIGGAGKTFSNGAEMMVHAALEMQEFMLAKLPTGKEEAPVEFRIGIHTGDVIAGIVGTKKLQYDIWGDTVNTAARMEQNSEASRVNISEATYQQVKNKFHFIYRGKIEAKNKGNLDMYFVELLSKNN